jgi:regulation of enolase protein 1 (concanavalin A-like superfamily)
MTFAKCRWINPPERWRLDGERLLVVTDNATDFWRETHYGFTRDNGHLFGCNTAGDFTMQVHVRANYDALYDQARIMVRLDERNWIRAGIEKSDDQCQLSSVLTIERSDWATAAYGGNPVDFWMRATVSNGVIRVRHPPMGNDGRSSVWLQSPERAPTLLGRCAARPNVPGLRWSFPDFTSGRRAAGICTISISGPQDEVCDESFQFGW